MRISDWSSDVCSSDLNVVRLAGGEVVFADCNADSGLMEAAQLEEALTRAAAQPGGPVKAVFPVHLTGQCSDLPAIAALAERHGLALADDAAHRSEEHTSELQSLTRITYASFCLKK